MSAPRHNAPQVVVEESSHSENVWRMATLGMIGLTLLACVSFVIVLAYNPFQSGMGAGSGDLSPTATRRSGFAATWTPTPTDTATPTAPSRPTATATATATATDTPTGSGTSADAATSVTPTATAATLVKAAPSPTHTLPARPTSTPRPLPSQTAVPARPADVLRVSATRTYSNCCSLGVFGTVKNASGGVIGGVVIHFVANGRISVLQTRSMSGYKGNDRNYEISGIDGLVPGSYLVVAVDETGSAISPSTAIAICSMGDSSCPQWYEVDFTQN